MRLAIAGKIDPSRIIKAFDLQLIGSTKSAPETSSLRTPKQNITNIALELHESVQYLDMVTFHPAATKPLKFLGDKSRLTLLPYRSRARQRAKDYFKAERTLIRNHINDSDIEIINAHHTYEYSLGSMQTAIPVLITVHDWAPKILSLMPDKYRVLRMAMQVHCLLKAKHLVSVSPYIDQKIRSWYKKESVIIPNPLGTEWFKSVDHSARKPFIIAVNNGSGKLKNVITLVYAFQKIRKHFPHYEMILLGTGYENDGEFAGNVKRGGLGDGIHFKGNINNEELIGEYDQASIMVHPSREESFGIVIAEAMARNLPVLGGIRSGAVPWVIGDSRCLVDINDVNQLAEKIIELIEDQDRLEEIGRGLRGRAEEKFQIGAVADAYYQLLKTILESR